MRTTRRYAAALVALLTSTAWTGAAVAGTVTVTKTGSGSGVVTSDVGGIGCGATCSGIVGDGTPITLSAAPDVGSQFTGWLGPCTGAADCTFTVEGATTAAATFAPLAIGLPKLDIDRTADCQALTDGLLILRHLFGFSGAVLTNGAVGASAWRTTALDIGGYLTDVLPRLDVDGNGQAEALTDGLLVLRYLFGFRGAVLVTGAVGAGAIRVTAPEVEAFIADACLTAIYVSTLGDDAAPGTKLEPKQTVNAGIAAAAAAGAPNVVVATGAYVESIAVELHSGVTVRGRYDDQTWQPATIGATTIATDGQLHPGESQYMAVLAKDLSAPLTLSDLTIEGTDGGDGRNSHGLVVISSELTLERVAVQAGNGATGLAGSAGASATPSTATAGMNGGAGGSAHEEVRACDDSAHGAPGAAGTNTPGSTDGGAGGAGGTMDTLCDFGFPPSFDYDATAGSSGGNAEAVSLGHGHGGPGGPATSSTPGSAGEPGRVGNGAAGGGGSGYSLVGGYLRTDSGTNGGVGSNGWGGGGGGGSGGNDTGVDSWGAGGGGGGAGGARAPSGAGAGGGGGASIGVYLLDATLTVTDCTIQLGTGGDGGPGGDGGRGQDGGSGGSGGAADGESPEGGDGGDGGHGGHGGGGGGGAGGPSAGIVEHNSTLTVTGTTYSGGLAGSGGSGGDSAPSAPQQDGLDGADGVQGSLTNVISL